MEEFIGNTVSRTFHENNRRYLLEARYGFSVITGNTNPHFAVTGDLHVKCGNGRWKCESCGMLHDEIAKVFPELKKLLPFHLFILSEGPIHYIANSVFWLEMFYGHRERCSYDPDPLEAFKDNSCFGVLPSDTTIPDMYDANIWLLNRLPDLHKTFCKTLSSFGFSFGVGKNGVRYTREVDCLYQKKHFED